MQETNWSYTRRMSSYLFLSQESSKDMTSHLGVRGDSLIMKLFSQILVLGNCQVVFLLHPTAPIPSPELTAHRAVLIHSIGKEWRVPGADGRSD